MRDLCAIKMQASKIKSAVNLAYTYLKVVNVIKKDENKISNNPLFVSHKIALIVV